MRFCEVREQNMLPMLEVRTIWSTHSGPTLADGFAVALQSASGYGL